LNVMSRDEHTRILGIRITDRQKEAGEVQKTLTRHGCSIRTRLGLHEVSDDYCSTRGLILLELFGENGEQDKLEQELLKLEGVLVRKMVF